MKIIPVIHYQSDAITISEAELLFSLGCDGVMLIHMGGFDVAIDAPAVAIKAKFPEKFVGTNRLTMSADEAIRHDSNLGLDGTWHDRPGINTTKMGNLAMLDDAFDQARLKNPNYQFFASVAFKYQRNEPNPGEAALIALAHGWLPTTSGPGTGQAVDVDKLIEIRGVIGAEAPLGVASGVTPKNAAEQFPYLTHVLVATGLCYPGTDDFDPELVKQLLAV